MYSLVFYYFGADRVVFKYYVWVFFANMYSRFFYFNSVYCNLAEFIRTNSLCVCFICVCVYSLGFSMYKTMSSADGDKFTSYFPSAFSCLSRISSIRLNISTVIFVLLLILVRKLWVFSIKCVVICEVSIDAFYQNGEASFCSCFDEHFKIKGCWSLSNTSVFIKMITSWDDNVSILISLGTGLSLLIFIKNQLLVLLFFSAVCLILYLVIFPVILSLYIFVQVFSFFVEFCLVVLSTIQVGIWSFHLLLSTFLFLSSYLSSFSSCILVLGC